MKNIMIVIKKELMRIFQDKRLIITLFVMPGLMLYLIYSFMGSALENQMNEDTEKVLNVYTVNLPVEIETILKSEEAGINATYTAITAGEIEATEEKLKNNEADLIMYFDEDFNTKVTSGQKPNFSLYFNPSENTSNIAYQGVTAALNIYKNAKLNELFNDVEIYTENVSQVVDEKKAQGKSFAMLIPFLILVFLFSGSMSVAPESIAGEKERGTIATILITPIKRSELAFGKVIALSILATFSAISSFIGLMFSLPKMMGPEANVSGSIYGVGEYAVILLILISTVLVIIGLMSIISSYSKSVKEATMMIMPLMAVTMLVGVSSMFSDGAQSNILFYFLPLYNSVQGMTAVLTFDIKIINLIMIVVSNVVYISIFTFILSKLFSNEKVMFNK